MDPNLLNIVLGLVTNGITSLLAMSGKAASDLLIGKAFKEKWELEKKSLAPLLYTATQQVAESVKWKGPVREEIVSLFLLSPEVEEIVREIYATRFTKAKFYHDLTSLNHLFFNSFNHFIASYPTESPVDKANLIEPVTLLFEVLVKECDIILQCATDKGIPAAHEAKSAFRHHIIRSELNAINKKLDFLVGQEHVDLRVFQDYEKKYRSQVGDVHSRIAPPNFDSARKLPLNELFVAPRFSTIPHRKKEETRIISMDSFLSCIYRAVLLGNPGGGKSTFSLKLCHDLATKYSQLTFAGKKNLTPILVILREYGADKKDRNCSILEFIENAAKATYQLPPPPSHTFEYLLLNGRVMVIFDGLDELLDTSYRQKIKDDVEAFCHLYPSVPVLITSREVGYEQAPLDEKMFETFRLTDFNEDQIQEYVKKWFNIEDRETVFKLRDQKVKAFLEESQVVPDLRSNPLMLSLLCNIYKGENYIPRNRPEVYEKCATMLFERWDRNRNLYEPPPLIEDHMRPLMEYVAQWIYQEEILRKGVTEQELINKATEYLLEWVFDNTPKYIRKAEKTALDFVQFCTGGRAWVFLDTGTKKEGEKLYQFAHATFLEYFTAAYFVRKYRDPDNLVNVLYPRIVKREWDVMTQLAFQLQGKNMSGAADDLLLTLVTRHSHVNNDADNTLSFAVRCLSFMAPRPRVIKLIVMTCTEYFLTCESSIFDSTPTNEKQSIQGSYANRQMFDSLFSLTANSQDVVLDCFEEIVSKYINTGNEIEVFKVLDLYSYFVFYKLRFIYSIDLSAISNHLLDIYTNKVKELASKNIIICIDAFRLGLIDFKNLIEWHQLKSLFQSRTYIQFGLSVESVYSGLVGQSMGFGIRSRRDLEKYSRTAKDLSLILLSLSMPWLKERDFIRGYRFYARASDIFEQFKENILLEEFQAWNSDTWFCAIILIAPLFEAVEYTFEKVGPIQFQYLRYPIMNFIGKTLSARIRNVLSDQIQNELNFCKLSNEQQKFIWSWTKKEFNLVRWKDQKSGITQAVLISEEEYKEA